MDDEVIIIDSTILDEYSEALHIRSNDMGLTEESINSDYSKLKENGLFASGFDKIAQGLNETATTSLNAYITLSEYIKQYEELERKFVKDIEAIKIFSDYSTNGTATARSFNEVTTSKSDGRSIYEGTYNGVLEASTEATNIVKEELKDIEKEQESTVEKEFTTDTKKENIEEMNLDKKDNVSEINYDENGQIKLEKMDGKVEIYDDNGNKIPTEKVELGQVEKNLSDSSVEAYKIDKSDYGLGYKKGFNSINEGATSPQTFYKEEKDENDTEQGNATVDDDAKENEV